MAGGRCHEGVPAGIHRSPSPTTLGITEWEGSTAEFCCRKIKSTWLMLHKMCGLPALWNLTSSSFSIYSLLMKLDMVKGFFLFYFFFFLKSTVHFFRVKSTYFPFHIQQEIRKLNVGFFSGAAKKYFHGVAIIHTAIYCIRFTRLLLYAQQIKQIRLKQLLLAGLVRTDIKLKCAQTGSAFPPPKKA